MTPDELSAAAAGLRANEVRFVKNKWGLDLNLEPAGVAREAVDWVSRILEEERGIVITSRPVEAASFEVEGIRVAYVFYESGLSINVMYTVDDPARRAVGFKLSEGMEVPAELASLKFGRQRSKLAGLVRGSFLAFKKDY